MNINSSLQTQWTPAVNYVRNLTQPAIPQVRPVEPVETPMAPAASPQIALKSWLSQYSNQRDTGLFDRVAADPSPEGTLFRRGLMISGVVSLVQVGE
ncbi:hypothetical protein IV102_09385 [bacterium]|nr:hypothetical protein [bacterium]